MSQRVYLRTIKPIIQLMEEASFNFSVLVLMTDLGFVFWDL